MPTEIDGYVHERKRVITGLYTLDKAFENVQFNEIGIPMSTMELFGPTGCGKTTLSWFILAQTGKQLKKHLAMMNIETFDPRYLTFCLDNYCYDGKVYIAQGETDEKMFDDVEERVSAKDYAGYCLDSVGAISPLAELEGSSGEANMGRRAKLVSAHMRKLNHYDRSKDLMSVLINHVHQNLGTVGSSTTGGVTIGYLAATRTRVKRKEEFKDGSFTMEGTVVKNRFGVEDRKFWVFVLSGMGVHKGMSAVYDCIQLGILTKPKSAQSYRWADRDEKIPTFKSLTECARTGDENAFQPFYDALANTKIVVTDDKADD